MKKTREELTKMNKAKCKELKQMRKEMAEQLGVLLHQRECTYEGFCTGTCPKCKQEEKILNEAIKQQKKQGKNLVTSTRYAAAGIVLAATVTLSGCGKEQTEILTGDMTYPEDYPLEGATTPLEDELDGDVEIVEPLDGDVEMVEPLEGDIELIDPLEGDVAYPEDETILEGKVVETNPENEDEFEILGEVPFPDMEEITE